MVERATGGVLRAGSLGRGASGWGCNAREPWAAPLFVAPRPAEPDRPAGGSGLWLVLAALLAALLAGAAGVYLLDAVVSPAR
jgi:hypothetical protein